MRKWEAVISPTSSQAMHPGGLAQSPWNMLLFACQDHLGGNKYTSQCAMYYGLLFFLVPNSNQEVFKLSSLDVTHASLVNTFWYFGGNERSQRFIERCIRAFRSFCLLGPEGTPVTWCLMDQTGEMRMAGTVPEYRRQGLVLHVICTQMQALAQLGFPRYFHVYKGNHTMQRVLLKMQTVRMPCDWNQWKCVPL